MNHSGFMNHDGFINHNGFMNNNSFVNTAVSACFSPLWRLGVLPWWWAKKAALMENLSAAKKAVIDREIFSLLERGLAPNLMSFVAELLGPEGLRRASSPAGANVQARDVATCVCVCVCM